MAELKDFIDSFFSSNPAVYLYPSLFVFGIVLFVMIRKNRREQRRIMKSLLLKPDKTYVQCRIMVTTIFNQRFPMIHDLAIKSIVPEKCNKTIKKWHTIMMHVMIQNLWNDLLTKGGEKEFSKELIHKAAHFEIKRRCIIHPYDLVGSRVSQTIEACYNSIRLDKEERRKIESVSSFKENWYRFCIFQRQVLDKIALFHENEPCFLLKIYGVEIGLTIIMPWSVYHCPFSTLD